MQNSEKTPPLLEVRDLRVSYGIGGGVFSRAKKFFRAGDFFGGENGKIFRPRPKMFRAAPMCGARWGDLGGITPLRLT